MPIWHLATKQAKKIYIHNFSCQKYSRNNDYKNSHLCKNCILQKNKDLQIKVNF